MGYDKRKESALIVKGSAGTGEENEIIPNIARYSKNKWAIGNKRYLE